jgi:hypothetical protein
MRKAITAFFLGLLAVSCAPSTPQTRIQQSPAKFESLSAKHRALVERGEITPGMSTDAVYLAWGAPSNTFQGSKGGKATERWDYSGTTPVPVRGFYNDFYGVGPYGPYGRPGRYGYSGLAYGVGPDFAYVPYQIASVLFINQKVDSWEKAR